MLYTETQLNAKKLHGPMNNVFDDAIGDMASPGGEFRMIQEITLLYLTK